MRDVRLERPPGRPALRADRANRVRRPENSDQNQDVVRLVGGQRDCQVAVRDGGDGAFGLQRRSGHDLDLRRYELQT